ncbi:MAG: ImmA/IrrE family metallo-endopeptidase [Prevotellaceae bacterium]|nr:ImmA/IrrE family metallo-endopeptidase [Prevotellaceae bacterium]
MTDRVNIPAERYRWAIGRAGMQVDDYIASHPHVAMAEWLDGSKIPTVKQLEAFAKSVNMPFGFLFLENKPEEHIPFPMFRGDAGRYNHFDLNVYDTVNTVRLRQDWLEEYLVENEIETCGFIGAVTLNTPVGEAVNILRTTLDLETRWAFGLANAEAAVTKMTERLENAGVFVTYNGVVGNNTHRPLKVSECRGFALVNKIAPYIFVNSNDAATAQLFTLVHEAAHLLLGISAGHAAADTLCNETEERYCDRIAAEFLVPAVELRGVWNGNIKDSARKFHVSELVIARRAHDAGLLSPDAYRQFWMEYSGRPPYMKRKPGRGGNFYRTSVKRVGRLFATHIKNAVGSRRLSYTEAYRLTGLYGDTYTRFMNDNI